QYSCAYFEHPQASLEEAQLAKKRHIAAKLDVEKGHSVLDIGCGWGGMGLYLANVCDARVTGVTLSTEQLAVANKRAVLQNLSRCVDFRLQDYRAVEEKFDRVVSVGMLEHVGAGYLDMYFAKVADVLKEDGSALIHTIGRTDGPGVTNPWIAKYIFPGGYIPAMSEVTAAIERAGLIIADIEVLRLHYADTLREWRARFLARIDDARALYDARFCRMWDFYLAGSEASFRLGQNVVFQFLLSKKADAVPVTRDYVGEAEERLRQNEPQPMAYRIAGE
ncbi:MAG: class I SAM-dependent methyltransferase, partial [Hyphomicrobiales bacterium]|nr:class I SAM-dependent methyltransferase [Hyphomicrobiales bacterium]